MNVAVSVGLETGDEGTPLAAARRSGLPLEVELEIGRSGSGIAPEGAIRRLRGVPVVSVALRGRAAASRGLETVRLIEALQAEKLVLPVSCWPAGVELESIVGAAVELDTAAREVGACVCLEMPLPGTPVGSMESYAALSRLLVRERLALSCAVDDALEIGLNPNQYWRYFAGRIDHLRLDPARVDDLAQWKELATLYGYRGAWMIRLRGDDARTPGRRLSHALRLLSGSS